MSLLGLFEKRSTMANPDRWMLNLFGGRSTMSGLMVSEQNALTYTAVFACVQVIAEAFATLPMNLYRRTTDGQVLVTDLPQSQLFAQSANDETGAASYKSTTMGWTLTWGNGYAEIERNRAAEAMALHQVAPNRVVPRRRPGDYRIEYYVTRTAMMSPYMLEQQLLEGPPLDRDNMFHLAGLGFDGIIGYSPVAMAREAVGLGLAAESYGAKYFGNSGIPSGILKNKGVIKDPAKLREQWNKANGGSGQRGTAVLEHGTEWQSVGLPPEDSQFLETRKFQRSEIASIFRVPPHKIGDLERSTNNNIEQQALEFIMHCLLPWAVRWEQEANRKLLTKEQRQAGLFFSYDFDELLRGDMKTRFDAYAVARQWGWMSADDVLMREKKNRLPGGQGAIYLMPSNMQPADKAHPVIDAQIAGHLAKAAAKGQKGAGEGTAGAQPREALGLNGAQITAAVDIVGKLRSGTLSGPAAEPLLAALGIDETSAKAIVAATPTTGGAESDKAFFRTMLEAFASNPQTVAVLMNALELKPVVKGAGVADNPKYDEPYLPVTIPAGQAMVSGEAVKDGAGSIVGGAVVDPPAAEKPGASSQKPGEGDGGAEEGVGTTAPPPPKVGAAPAKDAEGGGGGGGRMRANFRALLIDAAGRAVRKETAAVRRAAKKPEEFQEAIRTFYENYPDHLRAVLLPVAATFADLLGEPFAEARSAVDAVADEVRDLAGAEMGPDNAEALMTSWDALRAEQLATAVLVAFRYADDQPRETDGKFGSDGGSPSGAGSPRVKVKPSGQIVLSKPQSVGEATHMLDTVSKLHDAAVQAHAAAQKLPANHPQKVHADLLLLHVSNQLQKTKSMSQYVLNIAKSAATKS